jgi:hypothetical protein
MDEKLAKRPIQNPKSPIQNPMTFLLEKNRLDSQEGLNSKK